MLLAKPDVFFLFQYCNNDVLIWMDDIMQILPLLLHYTICEGGLAQYPWSCLQVIKTSLKGKTEERRAAQHHPTSCTTALLSFTV